MIDIQTSLNDTDNMITKNHKGIVVDNNDPDQKMRIKVSIPGIMSGAKNDLPWCMPLADAAFGDSPDHGRVYIPEVGTEVTINFPNNDTHFPYWIGRGALNKVPSPFQKNYPERYGQMDKNGTYFYNDKSTKEFMFHHCSGFEVHVSGDGQLSVKVPKGVKWDISEGWLAKVVKNSTFDTPNLHSTGESSDKVRTMSKDRGIFNGHEHPGYHGPTGTPTSNQ